MIPAYWSARLADERSRFATTSTLASSGLRRRQRVGRMGMIGMIVVMPASGLPGATIVHRPTTTASAASASQERACESS